MKKLLALMAAVALVGATAIRVGAHDPRTTAKDFGHSLSIEGAGKLELKYKAMHWNEQAYQTFMKDETRRKGVNTRVWNNIGTADLGFTVVIGDQTIDKGSYPFGLNLDGNDKFSIALKIGDQVKTFPLEISTGDPVEYLTFSIYPVFEKPDTFVLEGRGGKFRGKTMLKVPYLAEHGHGAAAKPNQ